MIVLAILAATTQINLGSIHADTWQPGPTKFTVMTKDERAKYLLHEDPAPKIHASAILSSEPQTLPESWSWMEYQTSIKDQGPCGSCWAFSTLGAVESAYRIAVDDPELSIDLSEQFAVSCLPGGCDGGLVETVTAQLMNDGVPDEACFPYAGSRFRPCDWRCDDWKARTFRIVDWASVVPNGDDTMRAALMRGPVVTAMVVYSDLWAYTGGVYEHVSGEQEGFHAVTLVGYDGDVWIAKNSWGHDFGEHGYLRIRQGQAGIASYGVQVYVRLDDVPEVQWVPGRGCGCGMVY